MDDIVRRWCDGDTLLVLGKDYRVSCDLVGQQMGHVLSPEFRAAVTAERSRVKKTRGVLRPDVVVAQDEFVRRWIDGDPQSLLAADYNTYVPTIRRWLVRALSPEFRTVTAMEWKRALNITPAPHHFQKGQSAAIGVPFQKGHIRGTAARLYMKKYSVTVRTQRIEGTARVVRCKFIKVKDVVGLGHGNWMPLARYLWQLWHGPIPKGHIVVHKNGDMLDDTRDNLIIVHKRDTLKHAQKIRPQSFTHEAMSKRCSKTMKLRARIQKARKEKAMARACE